MSNKDQFLLTEKYRPEKVDDCILTENIKVIAKKFIAEGDLPHLILSGPPGTGKSTLAMAMCKELGVTPMFINGSEENGIDTIRNKVKQFATALSFDSKRQYVIIDEADYLSYQAQPALRAMMEEFAINCGFIFTCNYPNKIIPALHSRCTLISFTTTNEQKKKLMVQTLKRLKEILSAENIKAEEEVLITLIKRWWPDVRRTINEIQRSTVNGELTLGVLSSQSETQFNPFFAAIKAKNYRDARIWIGENTDVEPSHFYKTLFNWVHENATPATIPALVILTADYQYRHISAAVDPQIHMAALTLEYMNNGAWK